MGELLLGVGQAALQAFKLAEPTFAFGFNEQSGLEPVGHSFRESAAPRMTVTLAPNPLHQ
ncbi:hypothetical protein GCM10010344_54040 [Streptomyces bluensis]|nr:hypothetical protein GCM10010344_54040 [Streptomyces bluensis]